MKNLALACVFVSLAAASAVASPVSRLKGPIYHDQTKSIVTHQGKEFINQAIQESCETSGVYKVTAEKLQKSPLNEGVAFEVTFTYAGQKTATGYIVIRNEAAQGARADYSLVGMDCLN